MHLLKYFIIASLGLSISVVAEPNSNSDDNALNAIDTLYHQISNMSDAELSHSLNLSEENRNYLLSGIVEKAKSLLDQAKTKLQAGFDWVMCLTVAKLNPLTNFLCKIPDLQKSGSSAQGYLDALKRSFGVK